MLNSGWIHKRDACRNGNVWFPVGVMSIKFMSSRLGCTFGLTLLLDKAAEPISILYIQNEILCTFLHA